MVDGCGRFGALRCVLLSAAPARRSSPPAPSPSCSPGASSCSRWRSISKTEVQTLPLALQSLFDPYSFSWGEVMAGGVVIAAAGRSSSSSCSAANSSAASRPAALKGSPWQPVTQSLYFTGPRALAIEEEPLRDPGPGEVADRGARLGHQRRHRAQRLPRPRPAMAQAHGPEDPAVPRRRRRLDLAGALRLRAGRPDRPPLGPGVDDLAAGRPRLHLFAAWPANVTVRPRRRAARRPRRPRARRLLRQRQHRL